MTFLIISTSTIGAIFGIASMLIGFPFSTALQLYFLIPLTSLAVYVIFAWIQIQRRPSKHKLANIEWNRADEKN